MSETITWALCPWFEETGTDLVHPDDLGRIKQFRPNGRVFTVFADEGDYAVIAVGADKFRVRPDALRLIKPPQSWMFEIGETVAVKDRGYDGTVVGITWHQKEQKPMYQLRVADKLKSKRYWPEELARRSPENEAI